MAPARCTKVLRRSNRDRCDETFGRMRLRNAVQRVEQRLELRELVSRRRIRCQQALEVAQLV